MTPDQFRSALHKGLGRAVLHVRTYGDDQVREHLLDACLHARSYDPQLEGSRAEWLLQMIDATSHGDFYREEIFAALEVVEVGTINAVWDADQLCDLALHYARRGHMRGRELLYRIYRDDRFSDADWMAAVQILALDGLEGMVYLAEIAGERILAGEYVDAVDAALLEACEQFGSRRVAGRLQDARTESRAIQTFLERFSVLLEPRESSDLEPEVRRSGQPPFGVILEAIDGTRRLASFRLRWFGRQAEAHHIQTIFERLLAEQDLEVVLRCLKVFECRELPELAPRVFELLDSDDEQLRTAAASALANSTDVRVREAAVERLEAPASLADLVAAIDMLRKNYRTGDADLILRRLPEGESTSDDARERNHWLGWALRELAESNADVSLAPCLRWLYEKGPCSMCRTRAVRCLVEWDELSEELRHECRFDVAEEIRELVL